MRAVRVDVTARKYLDIPLPAVVTTILTVAMLWPLEAAPPTTKGNDKLVHFIVFAALAFPLTRTGRFGLIPILIDGSAFGAMIKRIQPTFHHRAEVSDWIADAFVRISLGLAYRCVRPHRA